MKYAAALLFVLLFILPPPSKGAGITASQHDVAAGIPLPDTIGVPGTNHLPSTILVDYEMSPVAGVATMQTAAAAVRFLQDRYLPVRFGREDRFLAKTAGILYRAARLALVDVPMVNLHLVVQHEFFGHGARARLSGAETYRYRIGLPAPYGTGGGSAWTRFESAEYSLQERAALAAGGIEVTTLSLESLEDRWLVRGRMDYREALHYFAGIVANVGYIRDASRANWGSHDVESYLLNTTNQHSDAERQDAIERLRTKALVDLANFQLFLSAAQVLQEYLVEGHRDIEAFRVPVADVDITPQVHLWLAPYGSEIGVRVLAASNQRLMAVRVRKGAGATSVGLRADDVWRVGRFSVGGRVEAWRQPRIDFALTNPPSQDTDPGFLASTVIRADTHLPFGFVAELGAKSRGYVPGDHLGAGVVLRVGVDLAGYF